MTRRNLQLLESFNNPYASPALDRATYESIAKKLRERIVEMERDAGQYVPVAVVLICQEQECLSCGTIHAAHNHQLAVRAMNRAGNSWTRSLPLGLVPPHVPRERVMNKIFIPACANCFHIAPAAQGELWPTGTIEASFPIFDREGNELMTTPVEVEARRKLARKRVGAAAPGVGAAAPSRKPAPSAKPKLTLEDI
jgi:hypothetical protein